MSFRTCLVLSALIALAGAAAAQAQFPKEAPLRLGVGGDYPDGLDGVLVSRGLPYERVFAWELADPAVLGRYDVLLLSSPVAIQRHFNSALTQWITNGGRAYVEVWPGLQGPCPLPQLVTDAGRTPEQTDLVVTDTEHPITKGLSPSDSIDLFHLTGTFLQPQSEAGLRVLAKFVPPGSTTPYGWGGAAVLVGSLGKGEIVYSGAPLSFTCFHRGPTTEPLLMRIVDYLSRGRTAPRLLVTPAEQSPENSEAAPAPDVDPGAPPAGYSIVDTEDGPYNVLLRLSLKGKEPGVLLLDALFKDRKLRQPCLRLTFAANAVTLSRATRSGSQALATAKWQAPARPAEVLVKRRAGQVTVLAGERVLLASKADLAPGGAVALSKGGLSVAEAQCQPVAEAYFGDDFMREGNEGNPWTTVSGQWYLAGLSAKEQSVNAFYYRGYATDTALAAAGEDWWDDYSCSVAARGDGKGTLGLAVLRGPAGDYLAFEADCGANPAEGLRLVRRHGDKQTVLAKAAGGLEPTQWYRLAVRAAGQTLEACLDGERVLQCPLPATRGGGIALLVRNGSARFDDVVVQPASRPLSAPRHEGSPAADLPPSLGPQDSLTWANPAACWSAQPSRPGLLWHEGDFGAAVTCSLKLQPVTAPSWRRLILAPEVPAAAPAAEAPEAKWLTATAALTPAAAGQASEVELTVEVPGQKPLQRRVPLAAPAVLSVVKQGAEAKVLWNGSPMATAGGAEQLRRVGLEVAGAPVPVRDLQVRSPQVRDYVFGIAPTDWYASAGTWEIASRWACDSRWSWYAGWGDGDFAVWNKRPVQGDVAMEYYVGVKMEAPGGRETVRCRDLNATLCGDRKDPRSGYSFIIGGDGGVKTQLLRNGVVVAECPDIRVPAGYGIHHGWFRIRVARVGDLISMDFEGRPVFRYRDSEPLPGGYTGLWSRDSGILIPRVTIYQ